MQRPPTAYGARSLVAKKLWSSFFLVAKKNTTKMRGCLDLRKLDSHLEYEHSKMVGPHTIRDLLSPPQIHDKGRHFFHDALAPKDRRYFHFMFLGSKFECTAMQFGLASAPVSLLRCSI